MKRLIMCPRCESTDVEIVRYLNVDCLICKSCGYDERDQYDIISEENSNQDEKGRFSPYVVGGKFRGKKL